MSDQTEICQFCGGEIVFRVIRGKTTPMHVGDTNCEGRSLYRSDQEGIAHNTKCPRCEGPVIFLRNNGGSVWLDSLGWPWPKHPCFDSDSEKPVFPRNAESLKGGQLRFVKFLGLLKSDDGFIAALLEHRESLRKSPRSLHQWAIICGREVAEKLGPKLHQKCVLASLKEQRIITLDGETFQIREHFPHYYPKYQPR